MVHVEQVDRAHLGAHAPHLEAAGPALDVNGDGDANPFEDGILIVRYLFGQPDANLEDPLLITAGSTRVTGAEIRQYLDTLLPRAAKRELVAPPILSLNRGVGEFGATRNDDGQPLIEAHDRALLQMDWNNSRPVAERSVDELTFSFGQVPDETVLDSDDRQWDLALEELFSLV